MPLGLLPALALERLLEVEAVEEELVFEGDSEGDAGLEALPVGKTFAANCPRTLPAGP